MDINTAFSRLALKGTLARVKQHFPEVDPRSAGVCRASGARNRPQYLFELPFNGYRFAEYVRADNAYEARQKGWEAFLRANHIPEEE